MLIEYVGPFDPIDFGFYNSSSSDPLDIEIRSSTSTEIVVYNPDTEAVTVLRGVGFAPNPEISLAGTLTGFTTSDRDGNAITSFSGFSWSFVGFVTAIETLIENDNGAPFDALLNLQDFTVDLSGATVAGVDIREYLDGVVRDITIIGSDFGDAIEGGAGNDTINPGSTVRDSGGDVILASPGNDVYDFAGVLPFTGYVGVVYENLDAAITVNIDGAANSGTVASTFGTTTLRNVTNALDWDTDGFGVFGSDRGDVFTIDAGPQTWIEILGGDGVDRYDLTLEGIVRVGFRDSFFKGSTQGAQVNLQTGVIANDGFGNMESIALTLGQGQIELVGTEFADVFVGSDGRDRFILNGGNDSVDGGIGLDTLRFDRNGYTSGVSIDLAAGSATADWQNTAFTTQFGSIEGVRGTAFGDTIAGGAEGNVLEGEEGHDTVLGNGGNDTILGDDGNDFLGGGEGDDLLFGITGANTIYGGLGSDVVQGGDAVDVIYGGGSGTNQIFGNGGDDVIYAGVGDFIGGGAGDDAIYGDTGVNGFDTIYGGVGNDTVFGNAGNDLIVGGPGDDFLAGGAGDDSLIGDDGFDTIYLGIGNDLAGGGAGDDVIFGGDGANTIYGGLGNDTVQGGFGDETIYGGGTGANVLLGGNGDDEVYAGTGNDFVAGGAGNDTVFGSDGANTIYLGIGNDLAGGGQSNDVIIAGAGDNRIYGGTGDDTVVSGTGRDVVTGGPGVDVFVFNSAAQAGLAAGRDVITDFVAGVDKIDLSALNMTFIGSAGFSGTAGELRYIPGFAVGDLDGDGANDFAIELSGAPALTAGDFIL